jgi:hypothetical protein
MQGVAHAMRRSRFIALYISDHYIDSPWCRAEYLNALWIEEYLNIPRLLIICESKKSISRIPENLREVRKFIYCTQNERELAGIFIAENLTDNSTATSLLRRVSAHRLYQDNELLSFDERLSLLEQRIIFQLPRQKKYFEIYAL